MSQAKVDQHKKQKVNRKKEMRREKIERIAAGAVGIVIAAAICVWIGYSVYGAKSGSTTDSGANSAVTVNTDAIDDYLDGLGEE